MSPSMGRGSRRDVSTSPVRGQRSRSPKSHRERERERERERSPPRRRGSHREEKEKPLVRHREEHSRDRHREENSRDRHREEHGKDRHGEEHSRDRHREEHVKDRHVEEHNKDRHKERGSRGREVSIERSERRSSKGDKKEAGSSSSRSRHRRSTSPMDRDHHSSMRPTSGSPSRASSRSRLRDEVIDPPGDDHRNANDSVEKMKAAEEALEAKKKEEPSFELSGKLAAETNRVKGVTLLFNEPSDARKPDVRWRLYVFKAGEVLNEPLYIHRQSCYLFGRERRVADVPTDHPSCSKQHAIIQFRQVEKENPDGMLSKQVRPYLMDLGSTNGTFLNEDRIEPQRYYELFEKDTIKFGNSSREYVILHENSA